MYKDCCKVWKPRCMSMVARRKSLSIIMLQEIKQSAKMHGHNELVILIEDKMLV